MIKNCGSQDYPHLVSIRLLVSNLDQALNRNLSAIFTSYRRLDPVLGGGKFEDVSLTRFRRKNRERVNALRDRDEIFQETGHFRKDLDLKDEKVWRSLLTLLLYN